MRSISLCFPIALFLLIGGCPRNGANPYETRDVPGGGEGEGEGEASVQLEADFSVPWLDSYRDANGAVHMIFPQNDGNRDELWELQLTTQTFDRTFLNFDTGVAGDCEPDSLFSDIRINPTETWVVCQREPYLRVYYDENFSAQSFHPTNLKTGVVLDFTPVSSADPARRLTAARGGDALYSIQMRSNERDTPHTQDVVNESFKTITQIFPLAAAGINGDHFLVFDRGVEESADGGEPPDPEPKLVALQRDQLTEVYNGSTIIPPRTISQDAHAIHFLSPGNASGVTTSTNTANMVTFEPTRGRVRFWIFETMQEILPATEFEPNSSRRAGEVPAPEERILLQMTTDGYAFYTWPGSNRIWRIPLTQGRELDVRWLPLANGVLTLSGMVMESNTAVWVAYSDSNRIERYDFMTGPIGEQDAGGNNIIGDGGDAATD